MVNVTSAKILMIEIAYSNFYERLSIEYLSTSFKTSGFINWLNTIVDNTSWESGRLMLQFNSEQSALAFILKHS